MSGAVGGQKNGLTGKWTGPFPKFGEFLDNWVELANDSEWGRNDAPWWYNERASVGLLAGAVWSKKGWAFEEFAIGKGRTRSRRKGRGDLWFKVRSDSHYYIVEAKQIYPSIGAKARKSLPNILKALREACHDVSEIDGEGMSRPRRIGIVFVVPYVRNLQEVNLRVADFLKMAKSERNGKLKDCAIAWVFRRQNQGIPYDDDEECRYPGVLMLMRKSG
jgi:hypothetical protein